jgi:hypothetical protein
MYCAVEYLLAFLKSRWLPQAYTTKSGPHPEGHDPLDYSYD